MIRLNYHFKTKGPLHTGSDINAGTLRTLRRQKCILADPVSYVSRLDDEQRREAVVHIAMGVYRSLDMGAIKGTRLMGIWDEFTNKLIAAGRAANKYQFLEVLCRSWGLNSMTKDYVLRALDALSDYELLDTVRNESIYIVLTLRALKDALKEEGIVLRTKADITESYTKGGEFRNVVRSEDAVPCISGNSIRGKLRRLAMADFCKQVGIVKIDKRIYHTLFSGGFLDQSTQFENFDRMEQLVAMCPMLGVLGSAIGNMTIEGEAKIGWAYPLCKERGTGPESYWQYLDTVFQTRHDSSKTETDLEITGEPGAPQQMKYEYEVFADGTPFEHRIAFTSDDELLTAAFWHMLRLFHDAPFLGGMGSVGNGEVMPDWSLASGATYDNYLAENKTKIKEFWENAKV